MLFDRVPEPAHGPRQERHGASRAQRARRVVQRLCAVAQCPEACGRPPCPHGAGHPKYECEAFRSEPLLSEAKAWRARWDNLSGQEQRNAMLQLLWRKPGATRREVHGVLGVHGVQAHAQTCARRQSYTFLGRSLCYRFFRAVTGINPWRATAQFYQNELSYQHVGFQRPTSGRPCGTMRCTRRSSTPLSSCGTRPRSRTRWLDAATNPMICLWEDSFREGRARVPSLSNCLLSPRHNFEGP